jgi:hypothetical protein
VFKVDTIRDADGLESDDSRFDIFLTITKYLQASLGLSGSRSRVLFDVCRRLPVGSKSKLCNGHRPVDAAGGLANSSALPLFDAGLESTQ